MPPHSLTMTMIGASLLWVGWFGFNAGSNLEANGTAALAMINTFVATAAAALVLDVRRMGAPRASRRCSALISGAVAGLVAVTPAAGFAGPMGAIVLGLVAGVVCFFFCSTVKNALGYDDSLDVFGVHCVGGIIGALGTGILVNPALGGAGIADYVAKPGELVVADLRVAAQMIVAGQGRAADAGLVRRRLGDPLQARRPDRSACASTAGRGARRPRPRRARRARLQLLISSANGARRLPPETGGHQSPHDWFTRLTTSFLPDGSP